MPGIVDGIGSRRISYIDPFDRNNALTSNNSVLTEMERVENDTTAALRKQTKKITDLKRDDVEVVFNEITKERKEITEDTLDALVNHYINDAIEKYRVAAGLPEGNDYRDVAFNSDIEAVLGSLKSTANDLLRDIADKKSERYLDDTIKHFISKLMSIEKCLKPLKEEPVRNNVPSGPVTTEPLKGSVPAADNSVPAPVLPNIVINNNNNNEPKFTQNSSTPTFDAGELFKLVREQAETNRKLEETKAELSALIKSLYKFLLVNNLDRISAYQPHEKKLSDGTTATRVETKDYGVQTTPIDNIELPKMNGSEDTPEVRKESGGLLQAPLDEPDALEEIAKLQPENVFNNDNEPDKVEDGIKELTSKETPGLVQKPNYDLGRYHARPIIVESAQNQNPETHLDDVEKPMTLREELHALSKKKLVKGKMNFFEKVTDTPKEPGGTALHVSNSLHRAGRLITTEHREDPFNRLPDGPNPFMEKRL